MSYALMWTLFLLGHHPDVEEQVYEEVQSVIGHDNEISYDKLENLKYLECVIKVRFKTSYKKGVLKNVFFENVYHYSFINCVLLNFRTYF